jgi:hypothetical protein
MTPILVACIAALPPTLAIVWSHLSTQRSLVEIHAVVNSRLDAALQKISALEAVIRTLTPH